MHTVLFAMLHAAQCVEIPQPLARTTSWGRVVLMGTRSAKDTVEALVAVRTRRELLKNVTYRCDHVTVTPQTRLSAAASVYDVAARVVRCPRQTSHIRVSAGGGAAELPLATPPSFPAAKATACLSPVYGARAAEHFREYAAYHRAVGVDRFVVWDPTHALGPAPADVHVGNFSFQDALGTAGGRPSRGRTLAGLQLALQYCAFAFSADALLLLNLDLDEFLSCDAFADPKTRSVGAAVAAINARPWFRKKPRPCVCFPRVLFNDSAPTPHLRRVPVARQRNRKCAVDPARLDAVSLHKPSCFGGVVHVDHGDSCRVAHRRRWTGFVRAGRPVDDGVLVDGGAPPATDLDWWDSRAGAR